MVTWDIDIFFDHKRSDIWTLKNDKRKVIKDISSHQN